MRYEHHQAAGPRLPEAFSPCIGTGAAGSAEEVGLQELWKADFSNLRFAACRVP